MNFLEKRMPDLDNRVYKYVMQTFQAFLDGETDELLWVAKTTLGTGIPKDSVAQIIKRLDKEGYGSTERREILKNELRYSNMPL